MRPFRVVARSPSFGSIRIAVCEGSLVAGIRGSFLSTASLKLVPFVEIGRGAVTVDADVETADLRSLAKLSESG